MCLSPSYRGSTTIFCTVATDNHIGFMEKDPIRYNDSLEAFEEVLSIAKEENVIIM